MKDIYYTLFLISNQLDVYSNDSEFSQIFDDTYMEIFEIKNTIEE